MKAKDAQSNPALKASLQMSYGVKQHAHNLKGDGPLSPAPPAWTNCKTEGLLYIWQPKTP